MAQIFKGGQKFASSRAATNSSLENIGKAGLRDDDGCGKGKGKEAQ